MSNRPDVLAAGAVVLRKNSDDVLLVHRPKYDDWSFPKGKLDRGEHATSAAVREVLEETGLPIRLGRPLADQRYPVAGRRNKTVHYWVGRVNGDDDVSGYAANPEIDEVSWVSRKRAAKLLTYLHDVDTLREALADDRPTRTLIVLRHANARSRSRWKSDDRFRPLLATGTAQALRLVPLLAAYGVSRLVTSSSTRCVATVAPYSGNSGVPVECDNRLSEEDHTPKDLRDVVEDMLTQGKRTVVCTHRPVLPTLWKSLGMDAVKLDPAEMVVVHHRRGRMLATERHHVR